jgi:phosphohistidine phosphatase SixA
MKPPAGSGPRRAIGRAARTLALLLVTAASIGPAAAAPIAAADGWQAMGDGSVVLFRHAHAPEFGDPGGFRLDDCDTQRNLDQAGRDQARRIGQAFRERGVVVGAVASSQWCRARDTARLAFGVPPREVPAFNSFFDAPARRDAQTAAARTFLAGWDGPGVLVVVTHQVNITAITGITPAPGEGIVMRRQGAGLRVVGRLTP